VIRALAAGDSAVLIELADPGGATDALPGAAARLAAAIAAAGLPGVLDVIPGACTVLVTVEPGSRDVDRLGRELLHVRAPSAAAGAAADVVEIDVCYDGPDLADVAALTGLPVREVIRRHESAEYEVGWLGFSPGFGYLTGLDPALRRIPRLDTPRLSVPAGSVAIAGGLAAVYPASSPGGWRLLGRTSARLWDPDRAHPTLLVPGMRVRFRAVTDLPAGTPEPPPAGNLAGPSGHPLPRTVQVLQPGPLTTIQDSGRPGLAHLGVPRSGAADAVSYRLANALAGNGAEAACLEVTLGRLALRFDCDAVAALAGAPAPMRLSEPDSAVREPSPGSAFAIPAGSVLRLGAPAIGLRSYLAVNGGFAVAPALGSRSTDLMSRLGPAPLRAGDRLPLGGPTSVQRPSPRLPGEDTVPVAGAEVELTITAGPRHGWFTGPALETLGRATYRVTAASNRTGLRLAGPELRRRHAIELPSEGMASGSLQVSHDGQPILLLADHPTTGGYPVIAVVGAADIDRAAQLRPGQQVRFRLAR
jgi:KipI family sensor histidine kinase inhibitor